MRITRQKRPDRVICKWGKYEVEETEHNLIFIGTGIDSVIFPLSEIPNLIKALLEIQKSK